MTETLQTLPLKQIDADTVEKLTASIAERDSIARVVRDVVDAGLRNVYFVGAGGSLICSYPAHYLLQQKASFPAFQLQSDELNTSVPELMGPGSLVVLASYTGTTKETVAAAKTAKRAGATVIAAAKSGSPLAEAADVAFSGKSDLFELLVAYELLAATAAELELDEVDQALAALPSAVRHAIEQAEPLLADIAEALKDEPITYVLGSGPSYGWAYGFAMCFLQEMQWKHAAAFNSGEFFQGAFEMVDDDTAVLLWLGEDASRPMGERAKAFLDTYCKKAQYVDVRDLELPGIPTSVRGHVSPIVVGALANRLAQHFESVRGHDLEQRRYMFKVDY
jgi:fructoselysine-6-P-deglycase FrlB-like protein